MLVTYTVSLPPSPGAGFAIVAEQLAWGAAGVVAAAAGAALTGAAVVRTGAGVVLTGAAVVRTGAGVVRTGAGVVGTAVGVGETIGVTSAAGGDEATEPGAVGDTELVVLAPPHAARTTTTPIAATARRIRVPPLP